MSPDDAVARLRRLPFADVDGATVDHHRHLRSGLPEAIYGPGKSPAQCVAIVGELLDARHRTGAADPHRRRATVGLPRRPRRASRPAARCCGGSPTPTSTARIAVVTAGTSDIPVADEAVLALRAYGFDPIGRHRRRRRRSAPIAGPPRRDHRADAMIVVAGMEGALASVLGGLTARRSWRCRPASATAPVSTASPRCSPCTPPARAASRWSASTTGSAPPARSPGCSRGRTDDAERRIAWFNCQAGVAGDMTMAALVDAGADPDDGRLDDRWARRRRLRPAVRTGPALRGRRHVGERRRPSRPRARTTNPRRRHDTRIARSREILALLDGADLPERVRRRARAVFARLAEVEGAIHGVDPAEVELHEVGALDSIVDVVGVCAALEALDIDEVWCSPIAVGHGSVRSAHGVIPNPAPATVALLAAAGAPTVGHRHDAWRCRPRPASH